MKKNQRTAIAACLGLMLAGAGQADTVTALANGSFGDGLTAWSVLGDVSVQGGAAFLTNASLDFQDDYPAAAGAYNQSGTAAADVAEVEPFSGLSSGALGAEVYEGSALKQSFSVSAGQSLKFDWQFFTNENQAGRDYAYFAINGVATPLADALSATSASSPYGWETSLSSLVFTFTTTGTVNLAFGVVDAGDYDVSSALRVDNVHVVPVPAASWLIAPAMFALFGCALRRKSDTPF